MSTDRTASAAEDQSPPDRWQPTQLLLVGDTASTSTRVAEVQTDKGHAYIKVLGNPQGPHVLATEWVGTQLAKWFGLSTFDIAILPLEESDVFDLAPGTRAQPGPAFASRAMAGEPWGKTRKLLTSLVNPEDLTRLVVFDTWTLNCDRHFPDPESRRPNYDNVFLSSEDVAPGKRRLIAMDHGLCFIRSNEDLSERLAHVHKIKDERIYGLFPEFRGRIRMGVLLECALRLRTMTVDIAAGIIATVPREWEVSESAKNAWAELIYRRAQFVADNILDWIKADPSVLESTGGAA